MRTSSRRTAFATAALTAALALWTSGAPSVVYPVYGARWHIPQAGTTLLFAAYPLALLVVLALLGGLSDRIGRRAAMVAGLAFMAVGTLVFAVAPAYWALLAGRVLTGVGVGLALSPATAALAEYAAPGRARQAGSIATASTALGLMVALLVGGFFVADLPDPLHASYWPLLAAILITLLLALRLPRGASGTGAAVRLLRVHRSTVGVVVQGALGVAAAFGVGAIVLALGADVAIGLIGTRDPFVIGLVLALSALTIGVTALLARDLRASRSATGGALVMLVGLAVLVLAGGARSLPAFLVAIVLTGVGYSLLFAAGIGVAAEAAAPEHRAATVAAVYLGGYAVQAATAIGLGRLATDAGLFTALLTGAVVLAVLVAVAGAAPFLRTVRAPRAAA